MLGSWWGDGMGEHIIISSRFCCWSLVNNSKTLPWLLLSTNVSGWAVDFAPMCVFYLVFRSFRFLTGSRVVWVGRLTHDMTPPPDLLLLCIHSEVREETMLWSWICTSFAPLLHPWLKIEEDLLARVCFLLVISCGLRAWWGQRWTPSPSIFLLLCHGLVLGCPRWRRAVACFSIVVLEGNLEDRFRVVGRSRAVCCRVHPHLAATMGIFSRSSNNIFVLGFLVHVAA